MFKHNGALHEPEVAEIARIVTLPESIASGVSAFDEAEMRDLRSELERRGYTRFQIVSAATRLACERLGYSRARCAFVVAAAYLYNAVEWTRDRAACKKGAGDAV